MLRRVDHDDPAIERTPRWQINEYREEERMEMEKLTRPALRSVHRIVWHPEHGAYDRYVTVEAVTSKGPWLRVPGQPVLVVDWETWGRMVDAA
jgi:hypothetical protein